MSNKARAKSGRRPAPVPRSPFAKSRRPGSAIELEPFGFTAQRWLLLVAVTGAPVVVLTSANDPVNIPKLTLVLLLAIALGVVSVGRAVGRREAAVPAGLAVYGAVAFGISSVIATAVAPATGIALWGGYLRNAGLFLYLAAVVMFIVVVRVADAPFLRRLAVALTGAGTLLAFYSLLQRFDIDPIPWYKFAYSNPVSTMGNPDFAGAFYAIALPLAVWVAVWSGFSLRWRGLAALAVGLLVVGIVLSGAMQGYIGAVAALFVLALGWILSGLRAEQRRRGLVVWAGAGVVGLALVIAGLASAGPLARLSDTGAVSIRRHFWSVAMTMFGHHPVAGVGTSMYGDYFRFYRSADVVNSLGHTAAPDAPHSVPIAMFANGGLLLGLSYLAFVLGIGYAFVRALRRDDGTGMMLTAAIGAAWLAFQVASTVSIDVVPLVVVHFVLAGAIVARSQPAWLTFPRADSADARRRNLRAADSTPLAVGIAAVGGLVLAWFAIQPLRADVNAASAAKATARGDTQAALHDLEQATSEASWQGVYWLQRSKADGAVGNIEQGLADVRHAIDANPRNLDAVVSMAKVEAALKEYDAAARYYRIAIRLDPRNPDLKSGLEDVESGQPPGGQ